jgi:hypothetical protein
MVVVVVVAMEVAAVVVVFCLFCFWGLIANPVGSHRTLRPGGRGLQAPNVSESGPQSLSGPSPSKAPELSGGFFENMANCHKLPSPLFWDHISLGDGADMFYIMLLGRPWLLATAFFFFLSFFFFFFWWEEKEEEEEGGVGKRREEERWKNQTVLLQRAVCGNQSWCYGASTQCIHASRQFVARIPFIALNSITV